MQHIISSCESELSQIQEREQNEEIHHVSFYIHTFDMYISELKTK